jgi:hypothetical protein
MESKVVRLRSWFISSSEFQRACLQSASPLGKANEIVGQRQLSTQTGHWLVRSDPPRVGFIEADF